MKKVIKLSGVRKIGRMAPAMLLVLSSLIFTECKRTLKNEEIFGPAYKPAGNGFSVTGNLFTANDLATGDPLTSIDFTMDSAYFKADFNQEVSWVITVTGQTSGAVKSINGTSQAVKVENSTWDGGPSSTRCFVSGEKAVAELSFLNSSLKYTDTFNITTTKSYNNVTLRNASYFLVDDFENNLTFSLSSVTPDLADGPGIHFGVSTDPTVKPVSGNKCYRFYGTDENWNSYLGAMTNGNLFDLGGRFSVTDPTQLFFNFYVYGTGRENTSIAVMLYETDVQPFPPGVYDTKVNDAYITHVLVNWKGWKLISIPYSSFKKAPDPSNGGNGNHVMEPNKVSGVSLSLESYPTPGRFVDAYVDLITITQNGPFVP